VLVKDLKALVHVRDEMISLHIDRGSMQAVQHHVINSPEINYTITQHSTRFTHYLIHNVILNEMANIFILLAAGPSASHPE
jgi:hypothetical protein